MTVTALDPIAAADEVRVELARRHLYDFLLAAWHVISPDHAYQDSWYVGCLCEHLEAVTAGEITRLVINAPPRTLKSLLGGVLWFAWTWARRPASKWVYASYDQSLAERDSVRARELIESDWYRYSFCPDIMLSKDQNAKDNFANRRGGARLTTTPDGRDTGFDADFLVGDDLHSVKDWKHPARLAATCRWWGQSMATRGTDPASMCRVVFGHRVAQSDISGYLISRDLGYEVLTLPLEYEPARVFFDKDAAVVAKVADPIIMTSLQRRRPAARDRRTRQGECLHPARFTPEVIKDWKVNLGARGTSSQLQQRPAPAEGTIFLGQHFRRFGRVMRKGHDCFALRQPDSTVRHVKVADCRFFQAIDTAESESKLAHYTVAVTAALTSRSELLFIDVWRHRLELSYQYAVLDLLALGPLLYDDDTHQMVTLGSWPRELLFRAVEDKSTGPSLIRAGAAAGRPFKVLKAQTDKVERSGPLAALYAAGNVYHNEAGAWLPDFEAELLGFPVFEFDDQVDAAAHCAILVQHDVILRAGLTNRDMAYSTEDDMRAARAAEVDHRTGADVFKVRLGGGREVEVDFADD